MRWTHRRARTDRRIPDRRSGIDALDMSTRRLRGATRCERSDHDDAADNTTRFRHSDTACPNRHRQSSLDNDRTRFLMPFFPDAPRSPCLACNCPRKHDSENAPVRCHTTMQLHATNDGATRAGGNIESATIRIPLNEWPMSDKMRHVAEWLASHFANPVRMRQAADLVAMSERSLLRHFTREIGMAPSTYLTEVRLAQVCTMLERTALPVDSIARRCGLGSGDYLAHLFRRRFGTTPTDYRRAHPAVGMHVACRDDACGERQRLSTEGDSGR
ncbi:AraC family transcriptional regulator [Burkholderia sp. Bp8990]|nr:AraC family transcriptional regulator [Burkholderia sp. Bp8990]